MKMTKMTTTKLNTYAQQIDIPKITDSNQYFLLHYRPQSISLVTMQKYK